MRSLCETCVSGDVAEIVAMVVNSLAGAFRLGQVAHVELPPSLVIVTNDICVVASRFSVDFLRLE